MKNFKKVLAIILAMAMFFALSMTAFAATIVSHTQDANYLTLSVTGANPLTYSAVTVQGNGNNIPDVTTYSYYASFASDYSSLESTAVSALYPDTYRLYLDSGTTPLAFSGTTTLTSEFDVDFSYTHILVLKNTAGVTIRTYLLAGGISGDVLPTITIQIDVKDAVIARSSLNDAADYALGYIMTHCSMNSDGSMAAVTISNLPTGTTAMQATQYLCHGVGNSGATIMFNDNNISTNGLGLDIAGTCDQNNNLTYISGFGDASVNAYLSEFATGNLSGWLYLDPNSLPNYGAAQYYLNGGENLVWKFVNNYIPYFNF